MTGSLRFLRVRLLNLCLCLALSFPAGTEAALQRSIPLPSPSRAAPLPVAPLDKRACALNHAPDLSVYGRSVSGAFSSNPTLEDVRSMLANRVNLIFSYNPRDRAALLRMDEPRAQTIQAGGGKVLYNMRVELYTFALEKDIGPKAKVLPVTDTRARPKNGERFWLENERIACERVDADKMTGCERGLNDTSPAYHPAGVRALVESAATDDILQVRDSPNLWGFWVLDDNPGDLREPLRILADTIRQNDCREDDSPLNHAILCGLTDLPAVANFSSGVCDAVGLYPYPNQTGFPRHLWRHWMLDRTRSILQATRAIQPGIPLIGIYPAFAFASTYQLPSRPQVVRLGRLYKGFGAVGLMAFIWEVGSNSQYRTIANSPWLKPAVRQLAH